MQQLATIIQEQLETLVDRYDARLSNMPGYSSLPEAMRRDLERRFLNLIVQSLETNDYRMLVEYARQRADQWAARGLNLVWFQHALSVPEDLLVPLVQSVETSNFVWQALNRSQSVVWQMMAERSQRTEERFRSIVETAHSGIMIIDDEFHFVYANDQLTRISGYSQAELIGADFRQLLDEESRQLVADRYVRRQRGEEVPADYAVTFIRKDGQKRALEMSAVLLRDADGRVQTVAQVLDVTERKQAEAALARERNLLHTLIDSLPDQIFFKDTEGRVILNNMADARAMGVTSPAEAIGKNVFDLYPIELAELYHADDMTVIHSGQALYNREEPGVDEAGQTRWILTTKVPLIDQEGQPIGLVGFAHDITQRRLAEQRVQELLQVREHQARTSTEVSQEIAAAPELHDLFQRVVTLIKERFNYYHAQIFRYEPARDAIVLVTGYGEVGRQMLAEGHQLPMGRGVVGTAAASGQAIMATDVTQDQDWRPNPYLPDTQGELAVPIKLREKVLGILDVQSDRAGALSADDRLLLEGLCGQIAVALESTRLLNELRRSEGELSQALQIAKLAYWEYDVEKDLFHFNDQFYALFHTTAEQQGGYQLSSAQYAGQFVYPDDLPVVGSEIEKALNSTDRHYSRDVVHRILYADGGVGYISVSINIDRDEQGKILRYYGANQDITERQLAELAVRRSEAELSQALHIAKLAYWEYDVEKDLFHFNDQFYSIFHTTAAQEGGYQLSSAQYAGKFVYPEDLPVVGAEIERALNSTDRHYHRDLVHRIQYVDGGVGYVSVSINIDRDEQGKILRYYGANQDITERQLAEEAIRHSEAQLSEALHIAKLAYWEYDVEKDLFLFNDQFYAIFHTTAAQEGGYQLSSAQYAGKFVYPEDLPVVGAEIERALNSTDRHYHRDLVHRIQYVDGGVGYVSVSINIDRDEQGHILRYYGANQDVTTTRQAEEAVRRSEAELSQALHIAKLAYWEYDVEKDLFHFNDQFYSIFHTTAAQEGGYQLSSAQYAGKFVYPDDLPVVGAEIERALNSTDRHYHRDLVHRIQYVDGGVGYVSVSINIDRDEQGKILRYYGANQDITERQLAEEAVRHSEAQLSEALHIAKLAYWEYDVEKDLFLFNDQFYSIFHTTAAQEGGYQLSSAQYAGKFVYPDDLPVVGSEIEKALNSTDRHYHRQIDHRICYADGGVGYIAVSINIDRDEQGHILRYYGANQDITERKQIEEALAQEQFLIRILLDSVTDHIYFKDMQSRFIRISKSQSDRFGLSDPAQAVGKTDFDFFTEEHARLAYEDEQRIIQTGRSITQEERETWADQPDSWVSTTKFPLRDEAGNIVGTFGISHDITERKQTEILLAQERNLLRILIDNLPLHVYIKDRNSRFVINNKMHLNIMGGVAQEEVIGKGDFDFFPPEDAKSYFTDEQALMQSDQPLINQEETAIDRTTGQQRWVSSTKIPYHDAQGNVIGFVGVTEDITERKQAEIRLQELLEKVQQSEQLMRTLIDTLPDSIYAKDTESRFTMANLTEIQLNGAATFEDLRGKNDFDRYPRELAEQYFATEQPVLRDGIPMINREERGLDRLGNPRWHLSTKVPLRDGQGHIIGLVGTTRDITETKQAEAERERLLLEQQKRALQLQTASEVSRSASSILKLDELLPQAVELIRARFGFYYVGIFLADDTGRWAVLRAGTGEAGQTMLTNAHQLEIGGASMIGQCVAHQQARVALDVGQEAIRFNNPLLPFTRSEMALPLTSRGRIIGAMTIQSEQAAAFTPDDVTVLQSMADQISNAVENARLYEQANTALREVDAINRRLTGEAWETYLHHQAGQEVISLTDDSQAAPELLPQLDDLLAAGEITIEPAEDDPAEATVSAPILLRGQPIGVLRMRTPLDSWDKDTEAILTSIAGHVAQAVENARLIEQTQRTASRERAINEINARVRQTIDLDAILRTAVNELGQSLKAARVTARINVADDTQASRRLKTDTGPLPAADRPRGNDHD